MNLALILLKSEPAHPLFDAVPYIGIMPQKKANVFKNYLLLTLRRLP